MENNEIVSLSRFSDVNLQNYVLDIAVSAKQMSGVKNVTDEDLMLLVKLIVSELKSNENYRTLTPGELSFAVRQGCCYRYGDYGALSFGRIMYWIDCYLESNDRSYFLMQTNKVRINPHNQLAARNKISEKDSDEIILKCINDLYIEYSYCRQAGTEGSFHIQNIIVKPILDVLKKHNLTQGDNIIDFFEDCLRQKIGKIEIPNTKN